MRIIRSEDLTSFPPPRDELTPEELAEGYKLAREAFTAADLQRFTELDEGIPFEEILAQLEEMQKKSVQESK